MANITRRNPFLEPFEDIDRFFSDTFPALKNLRERGDSKQKSITIEFSGDNFLVS